jgi:hypothetical protein
MKKGLILVIGIFLLVGCTANLSGVDFGEAESPCELTEDMVGEFRQVGGVLEFVDTTAPDGWYADLEREGCRVGIWVTAADLRDWQSNTPEAFQEGAVVVFEGYLTSQPLPARPEEYQLILEVSQPPQDLIESENGIDTTSSDLPECDFPDLESGDQAMAAGTILLLDDSASAGVYLEIDDGGCLKRVWAERRFYDTWSKEEKDRLMPGNVIRAEGLYTVVRGQATVDISEPPVLE